MGSGFKDWSPGDVLTAADVDGYLMRQTVMTFADASARDTALSGVLDEGMVAYLEDTNAITVYNGSAWVSVIDSDVLTVDTANNRVGINDSTPSYALDVTGDINTTGDLKIGGTAIGTSTAYTPSLSNFTASSQGVQYAVVNDLVFVRFYFTISAVTGTPVLTVPSGFNISGFPQHQTCNLLEAGVDNYQGVVSFSSSTSVSINSINASGTYAKTGGVNASTPFTWGAGDVISGGFWYLAV